MTVVEVRSAQNGDTVVEAVWTPRKRYKLMRFLFRIQGECPVKFGWLIGVVSERFVHLFEHAADQPLEAKLRCHAAEMMPLT